MIAAHAIPFSTTTAPPDAATPAPRAHQPHPHPRPHHPDPLSALLSSTLPIADLAASLGLSLPDFLNLYQSPDFQCQLHAIDDLTQTRLRIQSAQARLTAIHALESLTTSATDPIERRRAASNLMRATSAATRRTRAAADDDDQTTGDQRPRARQLPRRRLRAEQVATLIARALADNDAPTPDSGLATLHAFLSDDTRAAAPHLPDFIAAAHDQAEDQTDDAPSPSAQSPVPSASFDLPLPDLEALADLLDATPGDATCSAPTQHGRTAHVDLHLPPTIAHSPLPIAPSVRFHLTRPDTGPRRMCWLIDRITRQAQSTGPPDD